MKQTLSKRWLPLALLVITAAIYWFFSHSGHHYTKYATIQYELNGKTLNLLVADTKQKRIQGLMHLKSLPNMDGMIFYFQDKQPLMFWNTGTHFDLQLYWLADQQIIGTAYLPSIDKSIETIKVFSPEPADTVIEVILRGKESN